MQGWQSNWLETRSGGIGRRTQSIRARALSRNVCIERTKGSSSAYAPLLSSSCGKTLATCVHMRASQTLAMKRDARVRVWGSAGSIPSSFNWHSCLGGTNMQEHPQALGLARLREARAREANSPTAGGVVPGPQRTRPAAPLPRAGARPGSAAPPRAAVRAQSSPPQPVPSPPAAFRRLRLFRSARADTDGRMRGFGARDDTEGRCVRRTSGGSARCSPSQSQCSIETFGSAVRVLRISARLQTTPTCRPTGVRAGALAAEQGALQSR